MDLGRTIAGDYDGLSYNPRDELTRQFGQPYRDNDVEVWLTPYHISVVKAHPTMWNYAYDADGSLPRLTEEIRVGALTGDDVLIILNALKRDPGRLTRIPGTVLWLEEQLKIDACRHPSLFGAWQITSDRFSVNNNPFGLSLSAVTGDDQFDLFMRGGGVYTGLSADTVFRMVRNSEN